MDLPSSSVDVLVVTYNHERFIARALDSILSQEISHPLRIVVADDASDDGTITAVSSWHARHPEVNLLVLPPTERLGITLNYYRGMARCTADYIAVLEGDDEWIAFDKLERQVELLELHPHLSMSATRILVAAEDSGESYVLPLVGMDRFWCEISDRALAEENVIGSFSSCVYRSEIVKHLPIELYEMTSYDWAFNLAVTKSGPVGFLPIVGTMYRQHSAGAWSSQSHANKTAELQRLVPLYLEFFGERLEEPLSWNLRRTRVQARVFGIKDDPIDATAPITADAGPPGEDEHDEGALELRIPVVRSPLPSVSVLLTSFNREEFVGAAIESVLEQDWQDFELIVVDDASSDSSWEVISSYESDKVRAYHLNSNVGAASALNLAVQEARGEFVAVLNCDDTWDRRKLQRQVEILEGDPDLGAVFTSARFVDEQGSVIGAERLAPWFDTFSQRNRSQGQWLRQFYDQGNALCHPSILVRREFYLERGLYDNRFRQLPDYERWIALVKWKKIHVMGTYESVNFRLLHSSENTSAETPENMVRGYREHSLILEKLFEDCPDEVFFDGFADLLEDRFARTNQLFRCEQVLIWFSTGGDLREMHWDVGLRLLFSALEDDGLREMLRRHYHVTERRLHDLMGRPTYSLMGASFDRLPEGVMPMIESPELYSTRRLLSILARRVRETPTRKVPGRVALAIRRPKVSRR